MAVHRLVVETSCHQQGGKCYNKGMYEVCMGTWRRDAQDFYGDLEEGIYNLSLQELQKISEKTSRIRNITQDDQFYSYNSSDGLVHRNYYFFLQETGMEGDLNTVSQRVNKQTRIRKSADFSTGSSQSSESSVMVEAKVSGSNLVIFLQ